MRSTQATTGAAQASEGDVGGAPDTSLRWPEALLVTADELIAVVRLDEDGRTRGVDPVRQAPLALVKAAVALRG
jgi:hypothetical protein